MSYSDWLRAVRQSAVERLLAGANKGRTVARRTRTRYPRADYRAERLEPRLVLSATGPIASPPITVIPIDPGPINMPGIVNPNTSSPYTPANIQAAYGVSSISFSGVAGTGAGQTIAIIDAYNDPNIAADAATFNSRFGLPQFNTTGNPTFTILNQNGSSSSLPANATSGNGGWDTEISLDVEWAHAIAPNANVVLFEANSASSSDLYAAVSTAANYAGVSVVSMSFGSSEFSSEHLYDSTFTTPSGHQGVTFVASTGDNNAPAEYPAYSPNVLAVGGTSLVMGNGTYSSESAWGNVSSGSGGGGGISSYETQPSFQSGKINGLSSTKRTAPDVSMLADVSTGVYMYDSYASGANNGGYYIAGGTSLSAPMWGALIAIANQGRVASGLATLDGPSQTLSRIYALPSSDFHDITTGNNGFAAGTGYDLSTGLGTPLANLLVPALAGVTPTASKLSFGVSPGNTTAGATFSPSLTVQVLDSFGDVVTTDTSNITITIGTNAGSGTLSGTATVAAINGIAMFTNLSINKAAAGYTLTAADGSLTGITSSTFTISAGTASQLVITQQPTAGTVGVAISPAFAVTVKDAFGNIITGNTSTVTLTLSSGGTFTGGATTTTAAASSGVATFSNRIITTAGTFTVTASDASLATATSNSITIAKATPSVGVTDVGGTYSGLAYGATAASASDPTSGSVIASFGSGLLSYAYYAGTLTAIQVSGATPLASAPTDAGAYTAVATYAGSANYTSATSAPVTFNIAARALHVTAAGQAKTYDRTTSAVATLSDDRVSGDALTISYGSAVFADRNVNNAIAISVTGITMTGTSAGDYTLANTTAGTSANITALSITGSITAASKTYDGGTSAVIASRTLTGVISGDTVNLVGGVATFNSKDVTSASTVTATGLAISGAQVADYTLGNSTETASAIIVPLTLTGAITASNKPYDGTTSAAAAPQTLAGIVGNDAVILNVAGAQFNAADVFSANTVTAALSLSGSSASDYALSSSSASTSASITPISVIASFSAAGKTYDRTTAATITQQSISGGLTNDDVTLTGGAATFSTADAGVAKTVTATGFSLAGAQAGDYTLSNPSPTAAATISPLSVSGSFVANNKPYDGSSAATMASFGLTGIYAHDTVGLSASSFTFDTSTAGNGKTVTATGVALTGAQAGNYFLSNTTETATASITPLTLTGSFVAHGKVYDDTTAATIVSQSLVGVLGHDDVTLTVSSPQFNSADVASANTVSATLSLSGAAAADYVLSSSSASSPASISRLPISVTISAAGKTYDGTTAATITPTLVGVLNTDDVTLSGGVANFATPDAATGKTVTAGGFSLIGAQAGDYTLTNPNSTATATITPLVIHGSFLALDKIYDGTLNATAAGFAPVGVVGQDAVGIAAASITFDTKDVGTGKTVTASGLLLTGPQAADYTLIDSTLTSTANITPFALTAHVTAAGKIYDRNNAATLTGEFLTGVKGNDDVAVIGGTASFNSDDVPTANVVTVTGLSLAGDDADDYTLGSSTVQTAAHITPVAISGNIVANDKVYDGTASATIAGGALAGVLPGDVVAIGGGSAAFDTKDVGNHKAVTVANLFLAGANAADYSLVNPTEQTTASITPLTITGSIGANNKVYDQTTTATLASRNLTGAFPGDAVSLFGGIAAFNSADVSTANSVTATALTLSGAQAGDYLLANPTESSAAAITPLAITGSITAVSKTFDGGISATLSSESVAGVLGTDSVTLTGGVATFASSAVGNDKIVTATGLSLAGADAADYRLNNPTETTTANISPLAITGTVFNDVSGSSVQPSAEIGLSGRTVTLQVAGKGTKGQKTAKTDANGNFTFSDLTTGSYIVKITPPTHWRNTSAAGNGETINLSPGQSVPVLKFGQTNAAVVSGNVFLDANKDGKKQSKEAGLAGWTIFLSAPGSSTPSLITTTDASGNYTFSSVPIGSYQLSLVQTAGYSPTAKAKSTYALSLSAGKIITAKTLDSNMVLA